MIKIKNFIREDEDLDLSFNPLNKSFYLLKGQSLVLYLYNTFYEGDVEAYIEQDGAKRTALILFDQAVSDEVNEMLESIDDGTYKEDFYSEDYFRIQEADGVFFVNVGEDASYVTVEYKSPILQRLEPFIEKIDNNFVDVLDESGLIDVIYDIVDQLGTTVKSLPNDYFKKIADDYIKEKKEMGDVNEDEDLDLSYNPLSTPRYGKITLKDDETFVFDFNTPNSTDRDSYTIRKGSALELASKYFDEKIKEALSIVKKEVLDDEEDPYEFYGDRFQFIKRQEDSYVVRTTDLSGQTDFTEVAFLGPNSPIFNLISSGLSYDNGVLDFDYNNPNYDNQEDALIYLCLDVRTFIDKKELPEDYFEEYRIELIDKLKDEKELNRIKEDNDLDLTYNPLDNTIISFKEQNFSDNNVESFARKINNPNFVYSLTNKDTYNRAHTSYYFHIVDSDLSYIFSVRYSWPSKDRYTICFSIKFSLFKVGSYRTINSEPVRKECVDFNSTTSNGTLSGLIQNKMDQYFKSVENGLNNNNTYVVNILNKLKKDAGVV